MKFNTAERQPIGAYYAPVLKVGLILILISLFVSLVSQNFYFLIQYIVALFVFIGIPYALHRKLRYNNYKYNVAQDKITIEGGIFSKTTTAVLFNLIQDVSVNEPILLKLFALADIEFSTPQGKVGITLKKEDALSLQSLITSKMSVNRIGMVGQKN